MALMDGWSVSGYLATGGKVIVTPNGNRTQAAVHLQGDFTIPNKGPGAQYFTVEFSVQPPPSGAFFATAEVIWSTKGNAVRRLISIVNGAVLSGTAQQVKVNMFDSTPADFIAAAGLTNETYYVDALVTPGARPSTQQPPRLTGPVVAGASFTPGSYQVNAGTHIFVPIDQNAGIISVNSMAMLLGVTLAPIAAGDIYFQFVQFGSGTNLGNIDLFAVLGDWIPIPPGANTIRITNTNAKDALVNVVFGVEG